MMRRLPLLAFACIAAMSAQQTVAPTSAPVGPAEGDNTGNYNVMNSVELGYRFRDVNGDLAQFRSDVNYGNGIRLLGSTLRVNSRDGHGGLFDEIVLRTEGLGNDPYEFASLHIEKNNLYSYDLLWRRNDYFNPALPIANGLHSLDTQRVLQDHDFTLMPFSTFKLFLGYSRNSQNGPALSTDHLFDPASAEFPLFENIRRLENEYRVGGEANFLGARLTILHGWVNYSEANPISIGAPEQVNGATLDQFHRSEPYRGSSPYWRLNLQKQAKSWSAGARYSYAGTRRDFFFDETVLGADRLGAGRNVQTLITGAGSRPMSTGDLTLSYFPGSKFTITNQTAFSNTRMDGNNLFLQLDNATLDSTLIHFGFLGLRTVINSTDLTYRVVSRFSVYGGYHFSTRRIVSNEAVSGASGSQSLLVEQNNDLHSGLVGLRFQPIKPLSINVDGEIGRASRPIFPIGERNYHALGARAQYKLKTFLFSAAVRTNYNTNSISVTEHSDRTRNYSANIDWTPRDWFALNAGYSKLHLDTLSGIAYFYSGQSIDHGQSIYISNIHAGNLMARFGITKRLDLNVGYSRIQDLGDGRSTPALGADPASPLPLFLAAQTFPLTFESPLARVSFKISERLRWNAGYQFYAYRERFDPQPRYSANTGYTSLLWSF